MKKKLINWHVWQVLAARCNELFSLTCQSYFYKLTKLVQVVMWGYFYVKCLTEVTSARKSLRFTYQWTHTFTSGLKVTFFFLTNLRPDETGP